MNLGLALVWAGGGKALEDLTKKVLPLNFNARLDLLESQSHEKYKDSPDIVAKYEEWIRNAHSIRELRNRFFHGRWGVSAQDKVSNVIGLPTSPEQESKEYSIDDLMRLRKVISDLSSQLADLREKHPT